MKIKLYTKIKQRGEVYQRGSDLRIDQRFKKQTLSRGKDYRVGKRRKSIIGKLFNICILISCIYLLGYIFI